jgi:MFS family permease
MPPLIMSNEETTSNNVSPSVLLAGDEAAKERTRQLSVREGVLWALMFGFGESYISPFAIALKAGSTAMAFMGTLPGLVGAFAQIIGANIVERLGRRKPVTVFTTIVQSFCYLPLFIIPYLFPSIAVPVVVCIFILMVAVNNLSAPAWTSMMGDVVQDKARGSYFARRNQLMVAAMILAMTGAGFTLSVLKQYDLIWVGFAGLFIVACLVRAVGAVLLTRHYDPPYHATKDTYYSFLAFLRRTPKSNFAKFTFAIAIMNGATNIAAPFFALYMLRDLHWTYVQFTLNAVAAMLASVLVLPWWGKISDRHGNRRVIIVTSAIIPFLPITWALTTNFYALLCVQVISGMAWSGFNLAVFNFIYDAVTPDKRPRTMSYFGLVNSAFSLLGGVVIGATLAKYLPSAYRLGPFHVAFLSSLPAVFVVSGVLRIFIGMFLVHRFKEVRTSEPISTRELLRRITYGEPFLGQIGEIIEFVSAPMRGNHDKDEDK